MLPADGSGEVRDWVSRSGGNRSSVWNAVDHLEYLDNLENLKRNLTRRG